MSPPKKPLQSIAESPMYVPIGHYAEEAFPVTIIARNAAGETVGELVVERRPNRRAVRLEPCDAAVVEATRADGQTEKWDLSDRR